MPPFVVDWGYAIRTRHGVYQARFDLRNPEKPSFYLVPDSSPDPFIERASSLPEVQLYWQFARFPTIQVSDVGDDHIVDFGEHRFTNAQPPVASAYFPIAWFSTPAGAVIEEGWLQNGMFLHHASNAAPRERARPSR